MHVLIIHQAFVSPNDAGGTRHYEFAQALVRSGHQVTIVASDLSYLTGNRVVSAKGLVHEEFINGIRILRAWTFPSLHRSFIWRVVSFLSFMFTSTLAGLKAQSVDVVVGTTPPIFQAVSSWFISLVRWRPFVLEVRDLWPDFAIDMGILRSRVLIVLSKWLELFLYRRASCIVVNSPAYRKIISAKGIPIEKIELVPNGVDPEMFDPRSSGDSVRNQLNLQGKVVVLYAGALGAANDLMTLVCAAQRLKGERDLRFLIVGDGKERHNLERSVLQLGIGNVIFVGAQPKSMMKDYMAASDVCVALLKGIPMFTTTYPNKVFDYMAAGRPTVLGIDGVIREVIEASGGGLFFVPGDDAALAARILELVHNREQRLRMGEAAHAYVCRNFNRSDQAKQFARVLWVAASKGNLYSDLSS